MDEWYDAASVEPPVTSAETVDEDLARRSSLTKTIEKIVQSEEGPA